jgi:site-specific DNA recombinase
MPKTAIIYARVSTTGQAEDELPVESQLESSRRKATDIDAHLLREFIDAGISGRSDDRPAFRDALAFCKVNKVDYFICWSTSRFARNRTDAAWHKRALEKCGTKMVYVSLNVDSSTKEGWMMEGMLELIDEFYSRQIADDTARSMMKNARDGYFNGGHVPFGFKAQPDGKRRRLAIVEHEAVIVRDIFDKAAAGSGARAIAMWLNQIGSSRRGAPWSMNTIQNMLHNWTMCGYVIFNRRAHNAKSDNPHEQWIKVRAFPALIDEEKFMIVQNILSRRAPTAGNGSPKSTHLFTGMLKCGECKTAMMIETATGRSARYSYYNCGAAIRGTGCKSRRITAKVFDEWMADYIISQVMSIDNLKSIAVDIDKAAGEWTRERERRRESFVADLRDIEARRRRLYNLLETTDAAALNLGDLKPRLMDLNERARKIETSLTDLELEEQPSSVGAVDLGELQEFVRDVVLQSNNPIKIREFFAGFIKEIIVFEDSAHIAYRKDRLVTANVTETVHSESGWLPERGLQRTATVIAILPERFRRAA